MTYIVSSGALNSTHSLTHTEQDRQLNKPIIAPNATCNVNVIKIKPNTLAQIPLGSSRYVSTRLDTFDVSSQSSSSCRACRYELDTAKMFGLDTSNVSSRVETWRAKWNLGYSEVH